MPDWILLLPILFPLFGAFVLAPIAPRIHARVRVGLPIVFLGTEIVAILVNIVPGTHRLTLSSWDFGFFSIALQVDGIALLLLLTMIVPLVALRLIAPQHSFFDATSLLVLAAAMLLTSAGNLVTIYIAWACLDLALFLWRIARNIEPGTAPRGLLTGQLAGLILLAGAILLATGQPAFGAALIALAFWTRLGLFPFHYLLPTRGADPYDLWFARGIPLIAAANLWLHWSALRADLPFVLIGVLAAVAGVVAVIWIWREETPARAAIVAVSCALALIPLAITFGGSASVALALWLTLTIAIALALFEIALRWRAENRNRWQRLIWFAALLSLAGIPLTPAFLGRVGLYVALWETGNALLLLIAGAATLVLLMPLWNFGLALKGSELREPTRVEYAGLVVISLAGAALAFLPLLIAHALAPDVGASAERALDLVVRTNDALGVAIGVVTLVIPIVGSFFARTLVRDLRPSSTAFVVRVARLIDLEWLERILTAIGFQMGSVARNLSTIAEENPTVWILFAALWIAIFIVIAR